MGLFRKIFGKSKAQRLAVLSRAQERFSIFKELLDRHNQSLRMISQLEERHQKGRLTGFHSVWEDLVRIQEGVRETIERMIELGGEQYLPLRDRFTSITKEVASLLPGSLPVPEDDYVIPFSELDRTRVLSAGTKGANLGEMRSKIGVPVPDGFAVSAWACQQFIDSSQLHKRVASLLAKVFIQQYEDLEVVSDDMREMVDSRAVPDDLARSIYAGFDELAAKSSKDRFALRSSAVDEDTSFSFAGQYGTFLNVGREDILDRYKEILASKFTPSAIAYLMRHSLSEMELAMGVICMEMVDPIASGVVYTKDPTNPSGNYILVNAIFGLGSYLVEGVITPDVFHVSRDERKVIFSRLAQKPVQLTLRPEGGVEEKEVPQEDQGRPSLDQDQLRLLVEYALKVEEHYGGPQDIEWALDRSGKLFLLQARPLRLLQPAAKIQVPEDFRSSILQEGGTPVCFGVGTGPIHHIDSIEDLESVPSGAILVAPNPSPRLVTVLDRINALVTLVGGTASHLATLVRELSIPTIAGMPSAIDIPQGQVVTVDASGGVIYDGSHPEWIPPREEKTETLGSRVAAAVLDSIIAQTTRLSLVNPEEPGFFIENCSSMHDLLRYVHQKSMEEMFTSLTKTAHKDHIGLRLKTKIPLLINIIHLDQEYMEGGGKNWISEDAIESLPMRALWEGVLKEGWPSSPVPADMKGLLAVVGTDLKGGRQLEFSENSYAFLSREYMLLSLRMGYHFSTFEALVTPEPEKNYIRMQFKLGGAPLERRIRRIWLICELLRKVGFENHSKGDFLETTIAYQGSAAMLERLHLLGRITILTKQLDLALSSDERARWYLNDFSDKLGLDN